MLAVLFPGQGSQSPGMLEPWLDQPGSAKRLAAWSAAAGLDLVAAGTVWDAERITDTAVAQPLLAAAALLSAEALLGDHAPGAVCGHSVGELPALGVAGVLPAESVVALAALRGRAMAAASASAPTGMAAALGGDPEVVTSAAEALGLEVATRNVAGQVVVGGPVAALQRLADSPPAGVRIRRLTVAGAFHTRAMAPAQEEVAAAVAALPAAAPRCLVVANRDGAVLSDGREALDRLPAQLTAAVRFDLCLATLARLAPNGLVEVAPGGTLAALATRALPDTTVVALRSPADLPAARALLASPGEQPVLDWHALSAPEAGIVDALRAQGDRVAAGETLAVVAGRGGTSPVVAPRDATVTEWLVTSGDPVRVGQPLAVLS